MNYCHLMNYYLQQEPKQDKTVTEQLPLINNIEATI